MNMIGSDKESAVILTEILVRKKVKYAVLSPGSRNAPLLISFAREKRIKCYTIVDERSAAFFALGISQQTGEPVALVCTSGTALLNYAPAVAEAYYQRLPLIVISADRPEEWIDQEDCQTIRQNGVFTNIVKKSYRLPQCIENEETAWYVNRLVNDALNYALMGKQGPVHINVPLREPLYNVKTYTEREERTYSVREPEMINGELLSDSLLKEFASCRRILIVAGFHAPDRELDKALNMLGALPNVVICTETTSNLRAENHIRTIDRVLSTLMESERKEFVPDLLITYGGSLVSKQMKLFLRKFPPRLHWSVGKGEHPADTFKVLTTQICIEAKRFFPVLAERVRDINSGYAQLWREKRELAAIRHKAFLSEAGWSDLKAFSMILPVLPEESVLQVANSTPVRYTQLFDYTQVMRTDCNRGTSGIDGSTSTAVGASQLYDNIVTLITGDMAFAYDSNALWNKYLKPNLKIIVIRNGGGGIFRFIPGPSDLEELEEYFETAQDINVKGVADLYGLEYYHASNGQMLQEVLPEFFKISARASLLEVETPRLENDKILKAYFRNLAAENR